MEDGKDDGKQDIIHVWSPESLFSDRFHIPYREDDFDIPEGDIKKVPIAKKEKYVMGTADTSDKQHTMI